MAPIRFGLVGGGWRAEFFTRVARELPERFQLAGVVQRDFAKAQAFGARWGRRRLPIMQVSRMPASTSSLSRSSRTRIWPFSPSCIASG